MDTEASFNRVCTALGGRAAMQEFFNVSDAALSQWKRSGFPPARALELERRLNGQIRAADVVTTDRKAASEAA